MGLYLGKRVQPDMNKPCGESFWREKTLAEMTAEEWESLCDGCGQCCLKKFIDDDTDEILSTQVACELLDGHTCRCCDYNNRHSKVPECVVLTPEIILTIAWIPESCAYRVLAEGRELAWWHPLVSGNPETVHLAGKSVRDRTIPAGHVHPDDLQEYVTG